MKWSLFSVFILTLIMVVYQNCGKAINKLSHNNSDTPVDVVAAVEDGYYVVVSHDEEPDHQIIDISEYSDEIYLNVARAAIQSHENQVSFKSWFKSFYAEAQAIQCGSVITSSVTVSGTLDCSSYTGKYGLILYGNNITLDGTSSKFKLIFPQGKVGILLYGNQTKVKNVEVSGMTNGMGILIYDSNQSEVEDSKANNNLIGITAYAENKQMNQVEIEDNEAKNNVLFGIRINSDWSANKRVNSPEIDGNNLSGNQYYALHIRTDNMTFDGSHNVNTITGSTNGWYLTGGSYNVQNFSMNSNAYSVTKTQIFVAEVNNFNMNSMTLAGSGGNAAQEAYGVHAYKTSNVSINNSTIQNYNVGVKVATDGGVTSNINVSSGNISNNTFAGIMAQGYDNTQLCPNINNVSYSNNGSYNLWKVSGGNFCN